MFISNLQNYNTGMGFHLDLKQAMSSNKTYPERNLNRVKNNYVKSRFIYNNIENKIEPSEVFYFKLPYTGKLLIALKSKIKWICNQYNINMDARLAFQ